MHPGIADAYIAVIEELRGALSGAATGARDPQRQAEAVAMLRPLIVKIEVIPLPGRGRIGWSVMRRL